VDCRLLVDIGKILRLIPTVIACPFSFIIVLQILNDIIGGRDNEGRTLPD